MREEIQSPTLSPPVSDQRDHVQGADSAAVTLVEYGDYECPYCGEAHPILQKLIEEMSERMRFVFRNFPLTQMHPHALRTAEAAEAAGQQGRFWEMHDLLYERQDALEDEDLVAYATELRLDIGRFNGALSGGTFRDRIQEDFMSGVRSGVNGTPTLFINGRRYEGPVELRSLTDAVSQSGAAPRSGDEPPTPSPAPLKPGRSAYVWIVPGAVAGGDLLSFRRPPRLGVILVDRRGRSQDRLNDAHACSTESSRAKSAASPFMASCRRRS